MFHALSWSVVVALLALWSLAAWALHALTVWTVSNAGALSGAASEVGAVPMPPWLPPEIAQWISQLSTTLWPLVDSLLQAAPAMVGGVTVVVGVVWGLGAVLLVLLGVGLHLLVSVWRRRSGGPGPRHSLAAG